MRISRRSKLLHLTEEDVVTKEQVLKALEQVIDPELHRDIVDLGMVRDVEVYGRNVKVIIALTVPNCPLKDDISADAGRTVDALEEGLKVDIVLTSMNEEERDALREKLGGRQEQQGNFPAGNLNRIKTVIAVMSGKGGVGKSTVAAMLAVLLRRLLPGARVIPEARAPNTPPDASVHGDSDGDDERDGESDDPPG